MLSPRMYKQRLVQWGLHKYKPRKLYENCAGGRLGHNGEEVMVADEELGRCAVPVQEARRSRKRKKADRGHARNTPGPQDLPVNAMPLQRYADELARSRKRAKPTTHSHQRETTHQNPASSADGKSAGPGDVLSLPEQADFLTDLNNISIVSRSEVSLSPNSEVCLASGCSEYRSECGITGDEFSTMDIFDLSKLGITGNEFSNMDIFDLSNLGWCPDSVPFSSLSFPSQISADQSTLKNPFDSEGYHVSHSHFDKSEGHTVVHGTQNTGAEGLNVPAIQEGEFHMADLCSLNQSHQKICDAEAWMLTCFLSAAYQASGRTLEATMGFNILPGLFGSMAAAQNIHMLPAIGIVAAIMEAYGYEYLASRVLQHACAVCDAYFGPTDDITLTVRFIVDMLNKDSRRFNLRPCDLEDVMCNMFNKFGESHQYTLVALYNLAKAYDIARHPRKAAECLNRLDFLCQSNLAPGHGLSIICRMSLARINEQEGHITTAVILVESAISQCKQSWGESHPYTLECMRRLAVMSQSIGAPQKIEQLLHRVLQGRRERLGRMHRYTIGSEMQLAQWRTEQRWARRPLSPV